MDCTPDLRLGRWQTALAGVECDALICDPPYSERTHGGQRHGRRDWQGDDPEWLGSRGIGYASMSPADVEAFVDAWEPRVGGWFCVFSDHGLQRTWEATLAAAGRYVFAPIPCVMRGMNVRLAGDGPSNWTVWLTVARRRTREAATGTLPGAYIGNPFDAGENSATSTKRGSVVGAKPMWLMRAIVRDYSRPGDLVVDPCSGGATTLLAAAIEGRRSIGSEMDETTYAKAVERIARGYTPVMRLPEVRGVQAGLDLAGGA